MRLGLYSNGNGPKWSRRRPPMRNKERKCDGNMKRSPSCCCMADTPIWPYGMTTQKRSRRSTRSSAMTSGYGMSDEPTKPFSYYEDIRSILDYCGVSSAHIVASSFGGAAAIDFTLQYPERINKLILVGPSIHGAAYPFRMTWEGLMDYLRVRRLGIDAAGEIFVNKNSGATWCRRRRGGSSSSSGCTPAMPGSTGASLRCTSRFCRMRFTA